MPLETLTQSRRTTRAHGISLVEVLVSVVVLSVGILGNAALYFTALQTKTIALSRMQAVNLANDMADRIRANRAAGSAYESTVSAAATSPPARCVNSDAVHRAICSPAEIAASDLFFWNASVASTLSGKATRSITVDTATLPTTYTIMIRWSSPASGVTNVSHSLRIQI